MDTETLIDFFGALASVGLILGYLPQAIQTIRTRNTDGISLPGFIMMSIGCISFVIMGLIGGLDKYWSLVLTNLVTALCSIVIFSIKMYNDYFKNKK